MLAETHVRSLDELGLVCHGSTASPIAQAYICSMLAEHERQSSLHQGEHC